MPSSIIETRNHGATRAPIRRALAPCRRLAPSGGPGRIVAPALAALLLVPVFCGLGLWQLERAAEKRALQAEYDRRATRPPVVLTPAVRSAERLQFSRVEARGTYETEYQLLWDNRIHQGRAGYHVITPLRIAGSDTRVLVNRGWVVADADRERLPAIDPPEGSVTVRGVAVVPHVGFMLGALDPLERGQVAVWQQLDLARYAADVEWPLQPIVILLDPESPGGYLREWTRLDSGVAIHQGYAFQWFVLAAMVLVLSLVWSYRVLRRGPRGGAG